MNQSIQLYLSPNEECPYIAGEVSQNVFADPYREFNEFEYAQLLRLGFRRSGNMCYRPRCPSCQACVPIRIPVELFKPNRNQRRCIKQHQHLQTRSLQPFWSDEHHALYCKYQAHRHTGGIMDTNKPEVYQSLIDGEQFNARMVEFRAADGELKMLSIIDFTRMGLSAVYAFFNPEDKASYGRYNILWQIEQAQLLGLPHVYLGYWVAQSHKMAYKTEYQPFEVFDWAGAWHRNGAADKHNDDDDAHPR